MEWNSPCSRELGKKENPKVEQGKRLIPMRWPAPWKEPSRLAALEGEPVNCLVFEDEPGCAEVKRAALARGLNIGQPDAVTRVTDGVWPGIARQTGKAAVAGPTGSPWVDSNGWRVRLRQAREPGRATWVDAAIPKDAAPFMKGAGLVLAAADAAAYGAEWVIQPSVEMDLTGAACREMFQAVRFFNRHAEWRSHAPLARLGIVSDFEGENEFIGGEVLNLAARRGLAYRIVMRGGIKTADLAGLQGILYVDRQAPTGMHLAVLRSFVQGGGLLIALPEVGRAMGTGAVLADAPHGYTGRRIGKGRVAEPKKGWADPYILASDAHTLLSRRNDFAKLFNALSVVPYVTRSQDGKKTLIHLPNYALRSNPSQPLSVRLPATVKKARWHVPQLEEWRELALESVEGFREVRLPETPVYSALEVE
jgi:hypothetical protein